ncbi:MAG TPA: FAD-dependent monooxygenase, partial [Candidatus Lokiarchaeia archaeon]
MLDETIITKAIIESYLKEFVACLKVDVIIVGGGPSGLVASKFLSEAGYKTIIFERKLSIGGGMLGGGMMFNKIVVQNEAKRLLDLFAIKMEEFEP